MTLGLPTPPISITQKESEFLSHAHREDAAVGRAGGGLVFFDVDKRESRTVLKNLRRPTQAGFADLNGDGREDIVVSQFGNRLGSLSWFEARKDGGYDEHVLFDRAGAVQAEIFDANKDGRPDIFALVAQGREGIYLLLNRGNGEFETQTIIEVHPAFGFSHFQLVDFNGDGFIDLLITNGDSGDYPCPPRAYHGIRLYLNAGQNHFREAWFYPLHGAYHAIARDFDGDGDLTSRRSPFSPTTRNLRRRALFIWRTKAA